MGNVTSVNELYSHKQIQDRLVNMAAEITLNYKDDDEIVVICLLKGGFMFTADLVRMIIRKIYIDFMTVSSYGNEFESSGMIDIKQDISMNIEGKKIILINDVVDSGFTMNAIIDHLKLKKPKEIKTCCLLHKRKVNVPIDFVGFECPDKYVVGYGMDAAEEYRNLPFIGTLK